KLPQVTLRFGRRKARIHRPIRLPGQREIRVALRHAQLVDSPDLAIDEVAQLRAERRQLGQGRVESKRWLFVIPAGRWVDRNFTTSGKCHYDAESCARSAEFQKTRHDTFRSLEVRR